MFVKLFDNDITRVPLCVFKLFIKAALRVNNMFKEKLKKGIEFQNH